MKRLKNILLSMDESTMTYGEMYNGRMLMYDPKNMGIPPFEDENPTYYNGEIGFEIRVTNKLAQDKPTVTVIIPSSMLSGASGCGESGEADVTADISGYEKAMADDTAGFSARAEAAADFCLREFKRYIDGLNEELYNRARPDYENGRYYVCNCGGEVLVRNGAYFALHPQKDYVNGTGNKVYLLDDGVSRPPRICLCLKLQVQLPRKRLKKAVRMLCKDLPEAVDSFVAELDHEGLRAAVTLAEKQTCIRRWLKENDCCAFVANGSILPREKGTELPMRGAVPFCSPPEDEVEVCGIRGMGIRRGVTVVTGGGYSGKSTLLDAVSAGIYNHVRGDGRELCITDETAATVSAEDGRSVKCANLSPFLKWLPGGDPRDFSTEHASGSTSQAANIVEALDSGAGLLVIDEDRSATNFMIRDSRMKELIAKEPLTPFTDRVRELHQRQGVSSLLVIGGSGEYLAIAHRIYRMEDFRLYDVTEEAREICLRHEGAGIDRAGKPQPLSGADWRQARRLYGEGFTSYPQGSGSERLQVLDTGFLLIGDEKIDIRGLHDIVSPHQLDALGFMLRYLEIRNTDEEVRLAQAVDELYARIRKEGLDFLYSSYFTTCGRFLDLPRRQELMAVINRMRELRFEAVNFEAVFQKSLTAPVAGDKIKETCVPEHTKGV